MTHPLSEIAEQAWNAIKLDHQPDYDSVGVEYRGRLLEWAEHARSGQPVEEGDHPRARFERKVVELSAETIRPLDPMPNPDPALVRFFTVPFAASVRVKGSIGTMLDDSYLRSDDPADAAITPAEETFANRISEFSSSPRPSNLAPKKEPAKGSKKK